MASARVGKCLIEHRQKGITSERWSGNAFGVFLWVLVGGGGGFWGGGGGGHTCGVGGFGLSPWGTSSVCVGGWLSGVVVVGGVGGGVVLGLGGGGGVGLGLVVCFVWVWGGVGFWLMGGVFGGGGWGWWGVRPRKPFGVRGPEGRFANELSGGRRNKCRTM